MEKEIEIKTPARKASVSKKTITACDLCGAQAMSLHGWREADCKLCHRDICNKLVSGSVSQHTCFDYDPHDYGDYPDIYCMPCWKLRFTVYKHLYDDEETDTKDN